MQDMLTFLLAIAYLGCSLTVDICDMRNVIYGIVCGECGQNYIGETINLWHRVTVHNQQIRDQKLGKYL